MWQYLIPQFLYDDDEGGQGSGKSEESGSGNSDEGKQTEGKSKESEGDGEKKTPTQKLEDEVNRLKREAAERDKKDREAEAKRLKEAGEHEKRADAAEARVAELEQQIADRDLRESVEKAAQNAGMEFPQDAAALLTEEEKADDRAIERGIRRLKEERPKLFGEVRRSGGDVQTNEGDRERERQQINDQAGRPDMSAGINRLRSVERKT